jgi:hypothetical protein
MVLIQEKLAAAKTPVGLGLGSLMAGEQYLGLG